MNGGRAYVGTAQRTFSQAIVHLLETDYALLGSRRVLELLAGDVKGLVEQFYPATEHVSSGWMVFTGVQASAQKAWPGQTAADQQLVTLAWPVLLSEDLQTLATMPQGPEGKRVRRALLRKRLARVVEYGWQHPPGPVWLTLADLGVMFSLSSREAGRLLRAARRETGKPLLTKGYYFDQGMRPTHKHEIIALSEAGRDEAQIARETHPSSRSVGRYLRDYEKVRLLLKNHLSTDKVIHLTDMQPNVVLAYVGMVCQYHPELCPEQVSPART